MKVNEYHKQLPSSKNCYKEVIPLLNDYFFSIFEEDTLENDLLGSDLTDGIYNIDVKDNVGYNSDNFIAEYSTYYKPSWLFSRDSICDYLLWVCTDKILLIEFNPLQNMFIHNEIQIKIKFGMQYVKSVDNAGKTWITPISKIPMNKLKKYIKKEWIK